MFQPGLADEGEIRVDFRHACLFPELVLHEGERDDDHQDSGRVEHVIGLVHVEFLRQPVIKFQVEGRISDNDVETLFGIVQLYVAFLDMSFRVEVSGNGHRLAVNVESVGIVQVGQMVEEVAHAAAHVKHHFRRCRRKGLHHAPAYVVRGEELSHLEFLLGLGVFMVAGEIRLPEVVQSSDSRVAVVDAFLRNEVLAGVYGEKDFLVDLGTPVLGNLLGYDGIHVFSFLMVGNEDTPQGCLTGCLNKYFMNHSSLSVISSSRSLL